MEIRERLYSVNLNDDELALYYNFQKEYSNIKLNASQRKGFINKFKKLSKNPEEITDIEGYFKKLQGGSNPTRVKKFQNIQVLTHKPGDSVDTILKNGHKEVEGRILKEGEHVIKNHGGKAGPEQWIIDEKTLNKKYAPKSEGSDIWSPKGAPMKAKKIDRDITITPKNWGGYKQNLNKGDYMITDGAGDTYGIGSKEFRDTYAKTRSSYQLNRIKH